MSSCSTAFIGAGLPLALLSARLTAERILKEVGVTRAAVKPIAQLKWSEP